MKHHRRANVSRRDFLHTLAAGAGALAVGRGDLFAAPQVSTAGKPTDARIAGLSYDFEPQPFRTPLKFGGSLMKDIVLFNVRLRVEGAAGRSAEGFGSMPLGNVWSFPPRYVPGEQSLEAMRRLCMEVIEVARDCDDRGHPIELTRGLMPTFLDRAKRLSQQMKLAHAIPKLCTLVVVSSLDAALHDAFGKLHGLNAYNALGRDFVRHDLSRELDQRFKGKYLDAYTLRSPKERMPLYHLVGALDPLTDADLKSRLDDGLPETLPEWIIRDELTHLKIKMNGDDLAWDVDRVLGVERVAAQAQKNRGVRAWSYSVDFNERCPDVKYLLEFFARIRERSPAAFSRIQYVEQPTDRDLRAHPENKMHEAAKIKPVVIDESLVDYESLLLAREQGYSGVALKACKSITEALFMAAAAIEHRMFLCVQDLTCPGASFLQSAELAARVPTVAAIEGNARQFCPAANETWRKQYAEVFLVREGTIRTGGLTRPGLGH